MRSGNLETVLSADDRTARDQQYVLAERQANTALGAAASAVQRDFDGWRTGYPLTTTGQSSFFVDVTGPAVGPVLLEAEAHIGVSGHRIDAILARMADAPAAIVLDADTSMISFSGSDFLISGRDARARSWMHDVVPSEASGYGEHVNAIQARTGQLSATLAAAISGAASERVRGLNDSDDYVTAQLTPAIFDLVNESISYATTTYNGNQAFGGSSTFGTFDAPVIMHVDGNLTLANDAVGYGLLLVDGDLTMANQATWHGPVVVRCENESAVHLRDSSAVYGALYVLHETGYELGTGFYPINTIWTFDDGPGALRRITLSEDSIRVTVLEGALSGILEGPVGGNVTNIEAFTFLPDGTAYFVNNASANRLYHIDKSQFDGDPSTAVAVQPIGSTGRSGAQRVVGLVYWGGSLYGISASGRRIFRLDSATGNAAIVRQYAAPSGFASAGLSAGQDGYIYTTRRDGSDITLWAFDNFLEDDPVSVMALGTRTIGSGPSTVTVHPEGRAFTHNGTRFVEGTLETGATNDDVYFLSDIQAMSFYHVGEGGNQDLVPALDTLPYHGGLGVFVDSLTFSGGPDIVITTTMSRSGGTIDPDAYPTFVRGETLKSVAANAIMYGEYVGGSIVGAYDGPRPLPLLSVASPYIDDGTGISNVSISFQEAWTAPFYLYVLDVDTDYLYITAFDAGGNPVSTASWTMTNDLDIVGDDDAVPTTLDTDGSWSGTGYPPGTARLYPVPFASDYEMMLSEIRVDNYADVREIVFHFEHYDRGETWHISFASRQLFEPGLLSFSIADQAQVIYSTESIGRMGGLIPHLADRSYFQMYNRFGQNLAPLNNRTGELWDTGD